MKYGLNHEGHEEHEEQQRYRFPFVLFVSFVVNELGFVKT
jgi:hypothetical protein